jgi:hypothetical protein
MASIATSMKAGEKIYENDDNEDDEDGEELYVRRSE